MSYSRTMGGVLPSRARIAVLSLHTSPLDQPGTGDSGGMNVYVRAVAERLARREVAIDVYTRCAGRGVADVQVVDGLTRVIQVPAGPCAPLPKASLLEVVPLFARRVIGQAAGDGLAYDLVHAHYWLSGWVGRAAKAAWDVPLVASFHTLGKVKNLSGADGLEPTVRLADESATIRRADRLLAPTHVEASHLSGLYGADPDRIRVVPPGVDPFRFQPQDPVAARAALGLAGKRVAMFVGRLQALKAPDVAVRTVAEGVRRDPRAARDLVLAVVGGPSGDDGAREVARLRAIAVEEGIADRLVLFPPRPHDRLSEVYAAADVLLMPSRSESFGLVALEAQACGIPVVASAVGGLRSLVADGVSGLVVPGHDPGAHAEALLRVLRDPSLASRLGREARSRALAYGWEETADGVLASYADVLPQLAPAVA